MTVRWNAKPTLRRPALVAAFSGWNDAADAASDGVRWLARSVGARVFATLDTEEYLDFQAARPTVELVDGVIREIQWPALAFSAGSAPAGGRDLVLLLGVEPNLRWPTFCDDVISVARATGCEMVVTLGALLGDVPHSRPMRCTGFGHRRGARGAARHGALALRRPDRHRRACCTTPRGGSASRRRRSGRRCRTTSRPRPTRRRRTRCSTRLGVAARRAASSSPTSRSRRARGNGRSTRSSPATPTPARTSSGSSSATTNPPKRRRRRTTTDDADADDDWLDEDDLPVGRVARRRLRALPTRTGRRVAASVSRRGRGRGRPRAGSTARATRCRRVRRCRGT